jgi:hypothetical protein
MHIADVVLRTNPAWDVARGAKPLEVEGIGKVVAARVMAFRTHARRSGARSGDAGDPLPR